ncbi:uncharacterized protein (TIGR02246 family) [Nocardioides sp. J9]|uniref:nuclear transport factor 2 family protein n=1 Tax=unclassified Nocardioides TaxID=2615069 RepID=UPI0004BB4D4C|nr:MULTISPECIES: nuclear transport factor 2 family protein [unclassified Nocardioides]TWG96345.1 uncharacterized protein (TIGR02246 family) [Nocardioides sp. J9]
MSQTTSQDSTDVLAELVAREQIRELAANYCHGIDKRDLDRLLGVFDEKAEWVLGEDVRPTGHDAIAEMTRGIWEAHELTHHWTANHVIEVDGDRATGLCDVDSTVRLASGEWKRAAASYRDEYRNVDGQWKITRREAEMSFLEPLG